MTTISKRRLLLSTIIGACLLLVLLSTLTLAKPPDPERFQYFWVGWWMWDNDPEDEFTFSQQHTAVSGQAGDASNFSEWELYGHNTPTQSYCFEGALEIYPGKHSWMCHPYCDSDEDYFGYYFWLYDGVNEANQVYLQFDWADRYDEYWTIVTRTSSTQWDYLIYNCNDCTVDATGHIHPPSGYLDPPHAACGTHEYYWPWFNVDSEVRIQTGDGVDWSDISNFYVTPEAPIGIICDYVDDGDGTIGCHNGDPPNLTTEYSFISNTGCDGPGGVDECAARRAAGTYVEETQHPLQESTYQIVTGDPAESPHPEKLLQYQQRKEDGLLPKSLPQSPWPIRAWVWILRKWRRIFPLPEPQDANQWWEVRNRYVPLNPPTPTPQPTLVP